jgi:hypothetical protein
VTLSRVADNLEALKDDVRRQHVHTHPVVGRHLDYRARSRLVGNPSGFAATTIDLQHVVCIGRGVSSAWVPGRMAAALASGASANTRTTSIFWQVNSMDWAKSETGKRLRGHHRLRTRLPLRRICHAARAADRSRLMTFETGSKGLFRAPAFTVKPLLKRVSQMAIS